MAVVNFIFIPECEYGVCVCCFFVLFFPVQWRATDPFSQNPTFSVILQHMRDMHLICLLPKSAPQLAVCHSSVFTLMLPRAFEGAARVYIVRRQNSRRDGRLSSYHLASPVADIYIMEVTAS